MAAVLEENVPQAETTVVPAPQATHQEIGVRAYFRYLERGCVDGCSLVLIQFFKAYNYRSDRLSVLRRPFANHWLNLAIVWELVLLGVIINVPWFQAPFGTFSFSAADWLLVTSQALSVVPVLEAVKWTERHEWFGELV